MSLSIIAYGQSVRPQRWAHEICLWSRLCPLHRSVRGPRAGCTSARDDGARRRREAGAGTLAEQLELVWVNIREILAAAEMTVDNIVRVTSYLRDVAYVEENTCRAPGGAGRAGGFRRPRSSSGTLDERWLVEIEGDRCCRANLGLGMRLLITGGAGYIGSIVAQHLRRARRRGHCVGLALQGVTACAVPDGADFVTGRPARRRMR